MKTECTPKQIQFEGVSGRKLVAAFEADHISSDGGLVLLHRVDRRTGLIKRFAQCFRDHRDQKLIKHSVEELVRQRVFALACGYEDLSDHGSLRVDPLLSAIVGKTEPDEALASPSTLNRLELTPADATAKSRYRKVVYDETAIADLFVDMFLDVHDAVPDELTLDLDATDDPIHGTQEGRFFHGYYGNYCYLPLYIFAGDFLLCAKLRKSDIDASAGSVEEVQRIVSRIRARWPKTRVTLRADSGFARDGLMTWCEENGVDYVFGLAKNDRLIAGITTELEEMRKEAERTGESARVFREFKHSTLHSWTRERRVVAKAEHIGDKSNPRFVVTTLGQFSHPAQQLYEKVYCARGDMENRIKEQQLDMFADRTSAHTMRANQLRLWFASVGYTLMNLLRHLGLKGTELERAQCGTIRTKLLKVAAVVRISVRRVVLSLSAASPVREVFGRIAQALTVRYATS